VIILRGFLIKESMNNESMNNLTDLINLAKQKGITLISDRFLGYNKSYQWLCKNKHKCCVTPKQVQYGFRCRKCHNNFSEEKVRFIFEQLTGEKFIKTRKILDGRLELDGYCKHLNIAFEYNGKQHYFEHKIWHSKKNNTLKLQKERDIRKATLCQKKSIPKIDVPYYLANDQHMLENYIRQQLLLLHIPIKNRVNWSHFNFLPDEFKRLKKVAVNRKGQLLSRCYLGSHSKHYFLCNKCNYRWYATAKDVLYKNSWCPSCANNQKKNISYVKKIAKNLDLILLSKKYKHMNALYLFACKRCGKRLRIRANNIQQGKRMCSVCAGNTRISKQELNRNIKERHIKLTQKYEGLNQKYKWFCLICNHTWIAKAKTVWQQTGCPKCAIQKRRITINHLYRMARDRDLKLLTRQCLGNKVLHRWKCLYCGKIYKLKPSNVKRGTSCRSCKSKIS